ncbi:M50 family metallopeptidase [Curtobacterium sp. ISL-83]|uniref:M50 family metallopeptidase n=1 Tax=Curtobacterium sp. ISL-83 TaxID=2819145 RepID=UPI0035AB6DD8
MARIAATIAHEVGHAVVVVPFGGRIQRIDLHPDGSGEAWVQLGGVPGASAGSSGSSTCTPGTARRSGPVCSWSPASCTARAGCPSSCSR